jgi:hypothetical protein
MSKEQLAAGDQVESRCTKCKDLTGHAVVAMVGNEVIKVQCKVCSSVHKYYPPKAEKAVGQFTTTRAKGAGATPRAPRAAKPAVGTTRASRTAAAKRSALAQEWEKLVGGRNEGQALAYSMTCGFNVNDLIKHSVFGLGVVTGTFKPDKVEVQFEEGKKLLRCAL